MQVHRFTNGGVVAHKVHMDGKTFSAWLSPAGVLLDAEKSGGGFVGVLQRRALQRRLSHLVI